MREKECYRDILARLDAMFPDVQVLRQKDFSKYTGLDRKTVARKFGIGTSKRPYITKEDAARILAM